MTDTTSIDAIEKLNARVDTEQSLLTDITRNLGLEPETKKADRWKKKLREELVREHILAEDKKTASTGSRLRKLFRMY